MESSGYPYGISDLRISVPAEFELAFREALLPNDLIWPIRFANRGRRYRRIEVVELSASFIITLVILTRAQALDLGASPISDSIAAIRIGNVN